MILVWLSTTRCQQYFWVKKQPQTDFWICLLLKVPWVSNVNVAFKGNGEKYKKKRKLSFLPITYNELNMLTFVFQSEFQRIVNNQSTKFNTINMFGNHLWEWLICILFDKFH